MKVEVKLTPEEVAKAIFNYVQSETTAFDQHKEGDITVDFDIEAPYNSNDPREFTTGGLKGVTVKGK